MFNRYTTNESSSAGATTFRSAPYRYVMSWFFVAGLSFMLQHLTRPGQYLPPKSNELKHTVSSVAPGFDFPRVYVVPLPPEFNLDLLSCPRLPDILKRCPYHDLASCPKEEGLPRWFVKIDDSERYKQISPHRPFGASQRVSEFNKTFSYSPVLETEYDADVYFHKMVEGYVGRVYKPEDADLFYLPLYWIHRLNCHQNASTVSGREALYERVAEIITSWIERFPKPEHWAGPNFFVVHGWVCSCKKATCDPLRGQHNMTGKLRLGTWETFANLNPNETQVVMPYMSQIHDMQWSVPEGRRMLLMALMGEREGCVFCGPCTGNDYHSDPPVCMPGCKNIRTELIEQLRQAKDPDVILWTKHDNPSTAWFPNGNFWGPKMPKVFASMLHSTFCLQPAGDTITRKSFFDSVLSGCIPVVFREDEEFVAQFPFSSTIPYRKIWLYIPEECAVSGKCGLNASSIVQRLRLVTIDEIHERRRLMKKWGRRLTFSMHNSTEGGYNDLQNPDAFSSTLREVWMLGQGMSVGFPA